MNEPLKQFICDTCNGVIEKPEDGWVEWFQHFDKHGRAINHEFRICHHNDQCRRLADPDYVSDGHLHSLLENNAMVVQLLDMLSSKGHTTVRWEDVPGIVEMLRRFTIPYYDEARQYLNPEDYSGAYDYLPQNLKALIEENEAKF